MKKFLLAFSFLVFCGGAYISIPSVGAQVSQEEIQKADEAVTRAEAAVQKAGAALQSAQQKRDEAQRIYNQTPENDSEDKNAAQYYLEQANQNVSKAEGALQSAQSNLQQTQSLAESVRQGGGAEDLNAAEYYSSEAEKNSADAVGAAGASEADAEHLQKIDPEAVDESTATMEEKEGEATTSAGTTEQEDQAVEYPVINKFQTYPDNYEKILRDNKIERRLRVAEQLSFFSEDRIGFLFGSDLIHYFGIIVSGVAIIWIIVVGIKFIVAQGDEEKLRQYKQEFGWQIAGLFLISAAVFFAFEVFDPTNDILRGAAQTEALAGFNSRVIFVLYYVKYAILGVMLIAVVIAGYQLILGGNKEDVIEKEKRFLQYFLLGSGMILMVEVIVRVLAQRELNTFERIGSESALYEGILQSVGILNYILTYVGVIAFTTMIIASIYLVSSLGEEDQAERAKRIVQYSLIAVVIAFMSYTLSSYLVSNYSPEYLPSSSSSGVSTGGNFLTNTISRFLPF